MTASHTASRRPWATGIYPFILAVSVLLALGLGHAEEPPPATVEVYPFSKSDHQTRELYGDIQAPGLVVLRDRDDEKPTQVIALDHGRTIEQLSVAGKPDSALGVSANGRWLAATRYAEDGGEARWITTVSRRFSSPSIRELPQGSAQHIRVSDDGNTVLLNEQLYFEMGHAVSFRTFDETGKFLGELLNNDTISYSRSPMRLWSDGSRVLISKLVRSDDYVWSLSMHDRNLQELWSIETKVPNPLAFAVLEEANRILVYDESDENCWMLDMDGKILWQFKTNVGGGQHFTALTRKMGVVAIYGGYELEVFRYGAAKPAWSAMPSMNMRGYNVVSVDISPDETRVVAVFRLRSPESRDPKKEPIYVVLYDMAGSPIWTKELPSEPYRTGPGFWVSFTPDGRAIVVREEYTIRLLPLGPPEEAGKEPPAMVDVQKFPKLHDQTRELYGDAQSPATVVVRNVDKRVPVKVIVLKQGRTVEEFFVDGQPNGALGVSENGRWLAATRYTEDGGEARWVTTVSRRFSSPSIRELPRGSAQHIQVSDDGNTVLLIESAYKEPATGSAIRTFDENGDLLGELVNREASPYIGARSRLWSDGSCVLIPTSTWVDDHTQYGLSLRGRDLQERWSLSLPSQNGLRLAVSEAAKRLLVCDRRDEGCWLLDMDGKVLWQFKTDVGGDHHPVISRKAGVVAIYGGYELEVFRTAADQPAWHARTPPGLRQYDVVSADISPDETLVVAAYCQIVPGRPESITAPRYVVLYDMTGKTIWTKEFPGNAYTSMSGPEVSFTADGSAIVVNEENTIRLLPLARPTAADPLNP